MTTEAATEMIRNALFMILKCSLPVLLVSMAIGLVISIFHTGTDTYICSEGSGNLSDAHVPGQLDHEQYCRIYD